MDKKIEIKKKIDLPPKPNNQPDKGYPQDNQPRMNFTKEIQDLKAKLKGFNQRLNGLESNEDVTPYLDKEITFELMNGTLRKGILKEVSKFQLEIEEDGIVKRYMKHAILCFWT